MCECVRVCTCSATIGSNISQLIIRQRQSKENERENSRYPLALRVEINYQSISILKVQATAPAESNCLETRGEKKVEEDYLNPSNSKGFSSLQAAKLLLNLFCHHKHSFTLVLWLPPTKHNCTCQFIWKRNQQIFSLLLLLLLFLLLISSPLPGPKFWLWLLLLLLLPQRKTDGIDLPEQTSFLAKKEKQQILSTE